MINELKITTRLVTHRKFAPYQTMLQFICLSRVSEILEKLDKTHLKSTARVSMARLSTQAR